MFKINNFFFSKILYKKVFNITGSVIGTLNDLVLDFNSDKPTIKAIEIKNGKDFSYILPSSLEINKDESEHLLVKINSNNIVFVQVDEYDIFLARNFLDKQIVDINGKKVERVNDVRLGLINGEWKLVAVDIGFRGLLRRLGVEYPSIRISKALKLQFRNTLIYWDNAQPLTTGNENLKLSTSLTKLETLHAADIADIIEDLDNISRIRIFESLNDRKAAEVLEEIESKVQRNLIDTLSDEKATNILESMPTDEAADVLGHMDDLSRVEQLLVKMEAHSSEEIRELMEYEENTVGSLMSKEFLAFRPDTSINDVFTYIKNLKPREAETSHIYIVSSKNRLLGYVNLLDLIIYGSGGKLYDLMYPTVSYLNDRDEIDSAVDLMEKYNLAYTPVVNEQKELIGVVSLTDLLHEIIEVRRGA